MAQHRLFRVGRRLAMLVVAMALVAGAFAFQATSVARAATFQVYDQTDLFFAIRDANDEINYPGQDTIELMNDIDLVTCPAPLCQQNGPNATPVITSDIFVQGNGYVLGRDLNGPLTPFRIFFVDEGASLILNDVTLAGGVAGQWNGGYVARSGGAIFNKGYVRLENNSVVALNFATRAGGGILNYGGELEVVENSLILLNAVFGVPDSGPGDYYGYGGGIANDDGRVTLDESAVLLNDVFLVDDPSFDSFAAGAGISNGSTGNIDPEDGFFPEVNVNNGSLVSGNGLWGLLFGYLYSSNTPYYGGGIYNRGGWVFVNDESRVNRNFAMLAGGGIYNAEEHVSVGPFILKPALQDDPPPGFVGINGNSQVSFNHVGMHPSGATPIEAYLTDFGYGLVAYGGGIFNAGTAYINDSTLEGNTAIAADFAVGGAIANWGYANINAQVLQNAYGRPADLQPGGEAWVGVDNGSQVVDNLAFAIGDLLFENTLLGGVSANGGGIANGGVATVDVHNGSHVDYNTAYAFGGTAYGGGIASNGTRLLQGDFRPAAGVARQEFYGTAWVNVGEGSSVDYNNAFASGTDLNQIPKISSAAQILGGYAFGGGISNGFNSYSSVYNNSSVDYNLASGEYQAMGGGIYNGWGAPLLTRPTALNGILESIFVDVNDSSTVDWNNVDNFPDDPPPFFILNNFNAFSVEESPSAPLDLSGDELDNLPYGLDDIPVDELPFDSGPKPRAVPGASFDLESVAVAPALQDYSYNAFGAGIANDESAVLNVDLSSVSHNGRDELGEPQTPTAGGGIFNLSRMHLGESNVRDNAALNYGGGIYNECSFWGEAFGYDWGPCADIYRTKVMDNWVGGDGGGIYNDGTFHIEESRIANNWAEADPVIFGRPVAQVNEFDGGGGIYNTSGALFLNINNTAVYDNSTYGYGGGVHNRCSEPFLPPQPEQPRAAAQEPEPGPCAMSQNSTYSGNVAGESGGGIYNNGLFDLNHVTITDNTAGGLFAVEEVGGKRVELAQYGYSGSGIYNAQRAVPTKPAAQSLAFVHLSNSIVYGNNGPNDSIDCSGAIVVDGNNVFGLQVDNPLCNPVGNTAGITTEDPEMGSLNNNGGPTPTHEISQTGSAFNTADPDWCQINRDQRNAPRPAMGGCDIGAYERQKERLLSEEEWSIEVEPISIVDDTISWTVEVCNLANFPNSGKVRIDVETGHEPVSTNPAGTIDTQTFWVDIGPLAPDECLKIATITHITATAGLVPDTARVKAAVSRAKTDLAQAAGTYCIEGSIADVADRDCIAQGFPTVLPATGGNPLAQVPLALWVALTIAAIAGAGAVVLKLNKRTA